MGISEGIINWLNLPKRIESSIIHIPGINEPATLVKVKPILDYIEVDNIFTIARATGNEGSYGLDDTWHVNLSYEHNGMNIMRIDYGIDLSGHHSTNAHIHFGDEDDCWYELEDPYIQQTFPNLVPVYSYNYESLEDVVNNIEDAIYGFLMTCNVENIDKLEIVYE